MPLSDEQFRANRFEIISRMADDLAHEIKNPINAIVINLEVLRVRVARGDSESALDRAAVIEHETRRLHGLVARLLQLLRPDREEISNLALDQAFDEFLPLVEAQVRLARNELVSECSVPVFVPVRRDFFKFAMLNVINATHGRLGEAGGTLSIRCSTTDDLVSIAVMGEGGHGPADAIESAAAIADAMLGPSGGIVKAEADGVVVTLPRAASV